MIISKDREIKRGYSTCTRRQFGLALGTISLTLTTTAGKMRAGTSLQSIELTLEEILQVALREIGSDVTKKAADNLARIVVSSATVNLQLRNAKMTAADVKLIANAWIEHQFLSWPDLFRLA